MSKNQKAVEQVVEIQKDLNSLDVDTINEKAPKPEEVEPQTKLTNKQMADSLGCRYIEPKRKLSAFGTLPENLKKEHAHDWEYVKGIYENFESIGEAAEFWLCLYPGDPDCMWQIPANIPVYVPRMVAKHLESIQQYHRFGYVQKKGQIAPNEFTHDFEPVETISRGKFRAVGAFN